MSLQWVTPRDPFSAFASKSSDGYYQIGRNGAPPFVAFFVEAVWARAKVLGTADTVEAAQQLCEQHAARAA